MPSGKVSRQYRKSVKALIETGHADLVDTLKRGTGYVRRRHTVKAVAKATGHDIEVRAKRAKRKGRQGERRLFVAE